MKWNILLEPNESDAAVEQIWVYCRAAMMDRNVTETIPSLQFAGSALAAMVLAATFDAQQRNLWRKA